MSEFSMFLEMVRRRKNFDIYCVTWHSAFSCTISIRMKGLRKGHLIDQLHSPQTKFVDVF